MTSKHTPGPWAVNPVAAQIDAMPSPIPVCQLLWPTRQRSESETEANARLIASAPEILQALTAVVEAIEKGDLYDLMCCNGRDCGCRAATNSDLLVHDLRTLIAKATGEQP